jgi:hypothetical protein
MLFEKLSVMVFSKDHSIVCDIDLSFKTDKDITLNLSDFCRNGELGYYRQNTKQKIPFSRFEI